MLCSKRSTEILILHSPPQWRRTDTCLSRSWNLRNPVLQDEWRLRPRSRIRDIRESVALARLELRHILRDGENAGLALELDAVRRVSRNPNLASFRAETSHHVSNRAAL